MDLMSSVISSALTAPERIESAGAMGWFSGSGKGASLSPCHHRGLFSVRCGGEEEEQSVRVRARGVVDEAPRPRVFVRPRAARGGRRTTLRHISRVV